MSLMDGDQDEKIMMMEEDQCPWVWMRGCLIVTVEMGVSLLGLVLVGVCLGDSSWHVYRWALLMA